MVYSLILKSFKQIAQAHEQNQHNIHVKSIHEVEHNGSKFTVAKTNHGHLVLFPYAKKLRPEVRARMKPDKIAFFNTVLAQAAALKKKVKKV